MTGWSLWAYLIVLLAFAAGLTVAFEWAWRRFKAWHEARLRYPWEGGE